MKRLVVIFSCVAVLVACAPASSVNVLEPLVGTYTVQGTNPSDGSTYALEVRITALADRVSLEYSQEGFLVAVGIGVRTGDVLSVIFQTFDGTVGLSAFAVDGDTLVGRWVVPSIEGSGNEILTRAPAGQVPVESAPKPRQEPPQEAQPGQRL